MLKRQKKRRKPSENEDARNEDERNGRNGLMIPMHISSYSKTNIRTTNIPKTRSWPPSTLHIYTIVAIETHPLPAEQHYIGQRPSHAPITGPHTNRAAPPRCTYSVVRLFNSVTVTALRGEMASRVWPFNVSMHSDVACCDDLLFHFALASFDSLRLALFALWTDSSRGLRSPGE